MKILLTHGFFLEEDPVEKEVMRPYAPLGLLYISAFLDKYNKTHEVFDSTFKTKPDLQAKLLEYKPELE